MAVFFSDDFSVSPLVTGAGGNWEFTAPPNGGPLTYPYTSGGTVRFPAPGVILYARSSQLSSYYEHHLKCTQWTWNIADVPAATITSSTEDSYLFSFSLDSYAGHRVQWRLRYLPPDVPPPEDAGTDTGIVLYPNVQLIAPPINDNDNGPEIPFDIADHKYLRIRDECRHVVFEYSGDGATWTEAWTYDLPAQLSLVGNWRTTLAGRYLYDLVYETQVDEVTGETVDDCPCGDGWRVGRVAHGNTPW